jgi:tetratricopeptide (TPR) repeat protein
MQLLALSCGVAATFATAEDNGEQVKLKSAKWMEMNNTATNLIKKGNFAEAEKIYKQILADRTELGLDLASERSTLADIYEKMHRNDDAKAQWETLLKEREKQAAGVDDTTVESILHDYAAFLTRIGKSSEAKPLKARANKIDLESRSTASDKKKVAAIMAEKKSVAEKTSELKKLGELWMQKSDANKSLVYYDKAIELAPGDSAIWTGRGEARNFLNQEKAAFADFSKAISLDSKNAKAYFDRAMIYESQKNYGKAIADFGNAIKYDPSNDDYLGSRGKLMDNMGKHKEAIADYTEVIKMKPKLVWPYVQRAVAYDGAKDYEKAIADYTALVERYPEDADYYEYRGKTYLNSGAFQKAVDDYSKVVQLSPKYAGGYLGRYRAYEKLDGKLSARAKADLQTAKKYGYTP